MKIKILNEDFKLEFTDLVDTENNDGSINFKKRILQIDISLKNKPRMLLQVLSHEIAHYLVNELKLMDIRDEENMLEDDFRGYVNILKYSPNYVEIEANANNSSFLVLADNYYPGWKVHINGSERNVLRVNYNLRGVVLPRGQNKVQFSFDPLSFKIGAAISFLTMLSIGVFFLLQRRLKHIQRDYKL